MITVIGCGTGENQEVLSETEAVNSVQEETPQEKSDAEEEEPQLPESTELFDEERLKLLDGMEYEGPEFENGTNEAGTYTALKIQNVSGLFLREADLQVTVNDKDTMTIHLDSVPADATVVAIGQGYDGFTEQSSYVVTSCKSSYEENVSNQKKGLEISFESGMVQIKNETGEILSDVVVRYKPQTENLLMGGNTSEITLERLEAGETQEENCKNPFAQSIQVVEVKE